VSPLGRSVRTWHANRSRWLPGDEWGGKFRRARSMAVQVGGSTVPLCRRGQKDGRRVCTAQAADSGDDAASGLVPLAFPPFFSPSNSQQKL
jgi:hypothetical protein